MSPQIVQDLLGVASGGVVGFALGFLGGGGSILAVPLMVYLVKVPDPHVAIGTSALAVAANAAVNLAGHARRGTVRWSCALPFAISGAAGAAAGSSLGKLVDGSQLLVLFAGLMVVVGRLMLRPRKEVDAVAVQLDRRNAPPLLALGGLTGLLSGFFGIGGGFLIVPSLVASTRMPMLCAVGSSLVAVTAFGLTSALNYALEGWVDWRLAGLFLIGGVAGGALGGGLARTAPPGRLNTVFAGVILATAAYMLARSFRGG